MSCEATGGPEQGGVQGAVPQPLLHGRGEHFAVQRKGQARQRSVSQGARSWGITPYVAEPEKPTRRTPVAPLPHLVDVGLEGGDVVDDLPPAVQEELAGRREVNPAGGPVEQLDAELIFQLADLLGERWLGHMQALGGAAEVPLLGDCDEVVQLADVQRWSRPSAHRPRCRSTIYSKNNHNKPY